VRLVKSAVRPLRREAKERLVVDALILLSWLLTFRLLMVEEEMVVVASVDTPVTIREEDAVRVAVVMFELDALVILAVVAVRLVMIAVTALRTVASKEEEEREEMVVVASVDVPDTERLLVTERFVLDALPIVEEAEMRLLDVRIVTVVVASVVVPVNVLAPTNV
jgi:hypothetical protein